MRGSPLLRATLMVVALLALLIPLRSLTSARSVPAAGPVATAVGAEPVRLQLTATEAPFTFSVSHLGKVIWRGDAGASPVETVVKLPFPAEGIDLALEASWPSGQTAAVRLDVARGEDDPIPQTVWGAGAVNEVLTFK